MTLPLSLNIPSWLADLLCATHKSSAANKRIQTIWVEQPVLTTSFYREYLGFYVILKKGRGNEKSFLIYKLGNWIWIKSTFSVEYSTSQHKNDQRLTIYSKSVEKYYANLKAMMRVVKHIDQTMNCEKSFSIKDCNGIEIVYRSDISN